MKNKERVLEVLDMIRKDAERDASQFDGKPFCGKTCGEYMGNHGAAIAALADIVKSIVEEVN